MTTFNKLTPLAVAALLWSTAAPAHVVLEQPEAKIGASYKAVLRVTHGCNGSPTVKVTVRIPEGLIAVKPMPKPGWQIAMTRGPYAKGYGFYHGATLSEGVTEIVWSGGSLPDAFFDEFVLSGFVAKELGAGGKLYFPVVQECESGAHHWVQTESSAQPSHSGHGADPAPSVRLRGD